MDLNVYVSGKGKKIKKKVSLVWGVKSFIEFLPV
jgi:hypothetical protein